MEFIINTAQFEKMIDNKIIGNPTLNNTKINFFGKNNILICDNNIELNNANLEFKGNNSIVYLSSNLKDNFRLIIYNNSSGYVGKNADIGFSVTIKICENQNIIIGDDCILGDYVYISNSDSFSIYNFSSKKRINFSSSIYIGDHVFLGNNVYISKGVRIGSGSIINNFSFVPSYSKIPSNTYSSGNPAKIISNEVFFTNDCSNSYKHEDIINSEYYKSDVFLYTIIPQETLSLENIDNILKELDVESRWEFIQKLFIRNKRKNRFSL